MKAIMVELTEGQRQALQPLFDLVIQGNLVGESSVIAAQVFEDGMVVKRVTERETKVVWDDGWHISAEECTQEQHKKEAA